MYEDTKYYFQQKTNGGTSMTSGIRNTTWTTHILKENLPLEPHTNLYQQMSTTSGKENNLPNHIHHHHQDILSSPQYCKGIGVPYIMITYVWE